MRLHTYLLSVVAICAIAFSFSASPASASLTFTTNSIAGTASSTLDVGSGNTLSIQTTNDGPVTLGSGALTLSGITGSTQCLHVNSSGVVSGTGSDCGSGSSSITIGSTAITSGTNGRLLYDNSGTVGELATTGSGNVVLASSPTLTTPNLGAATASGLTLSSITGSTQCLRVDSSGIVSGTGSDCGSGSSSITIGSTTITSGTNGRILYDNAGAVGELATTGSGNVVLATSPSFTTPSLGSATASGLTLSGITGSTQCLHVDSSGIVSGTGSDCGSGGGGSAPFSDATAIVKNGTDATKLFKIDASGITTGNTVTASSPIATGSFTFARQDAAQTFTGTQTFSSQAVFTNTSNLFGTGTASTDVAFRKGSAVDGVANWEAITGSAGSLAFITANGFSNGGYLITSDAGLPTVWNVTKTSNLAWVAGAFGLRIPGAGADVYFSRSAPGVVNIGSTSTGVDGFVNAASYRGGVASGTNAAGQSVSAAGGISTGNARPGDYTIKTSVEGSSGSSMQTLQDRVHVHGPARTLSDGAATNVFTLALPAGSAGGGKIEVTITATDGTDYQSLTQEVTYAAVNKSGTYTKDVDVIGSSNSVSAGTLAATWALADSTNAVIMQVTADSSLTSPTITARYTLIENSGKAITYPD